MQKPIVYKDACVNPTSSPIKGMPRFGLGGYYERMPILIVTKKHRACFKNRSGKGLRARRGGWRGATRAHIRQKSVTEEQRSQPPRPAARPTGIFSKPALTHFASLLVLLVSLFCLPIGCLAEDNNPPASPEVTAALQPYLDSYKLAGIIGIIADKTGKVYYKNLLGYADVGGKKEPISENNVFWIASMSKMFVGASIMMLVDEGKVSLNDPVTNYIPQLAKWMVYRGKGSIAPCFTGSRWVRPVTLRNLLNTIPAALPALSELQQATGAKTAHRSGFAALSSVAGSAAMAAGRQVSVWQPRDEHRRPRGGNRQRDALRKVFAKTLF